jgi:signal transduction histidine kinase
MKLGARDFIVKNFGSNFSEVLGLSLSRVFAGVRLEAEKRRLEREMGVLRRAIQNSHDGLAVVLRDGSVRWSNRSLQGFLEHYGSDLANFLSLDPEKLAKGKELIASLHENLHGLPLGGLWNTEMVVKEDKAKAYDISLSVAGERGGEAGEECAVWVRDISEQKRRERFQREILSTTTHDLKGPLGAILTACELLTDMLVGQEKPTELVLRLQSSAHGILNLIEEFLSARRIKEGSFILRPEQIPAQDLLKEVREQYETIAKARRIDFSMHVSPDVEMICVDHLGFTRVLGNLLSNAFKFTPREGSVSVQLETRGEDVIVRVKDSGAGMEPAEALHIFERFSRLAEHGAVAGTGLGLFVVKCIVEAHGGNIQVTSQPGQGTVFTVTFPGHPPVNERGELISLEFA